MDASDDLRAVTAKYFDTINFSELNDKWIEEVIINEFTDAEENNMTINILFVDDPVKTLNKLADICNAWCEKSKENESSLNNQANASSVSFQEEVLWNVLDEMDISAKHILGLIYLLCDRAKKKTASQEEKVLGLASVRLYFNCLKVPGSAAYSIYHPNLFQLCIDALPILDFTTEKDTFVLKEFQNMSSLYMSTLINLIEILKSFYLGNDSNTVEHVIKKLVELTACEVQNHINFNVNILEFGEKEMKRRFKATFIVSALAYQAFLSLLDTDLNGDKDQNYVIILSHLNRLISCYKARKSQTISQKHLVIKDNAVAFVCHNLKAEFAAEPTLTALKRLCLVVSEKTDFRATVSAAIINILFFMGSEHIARMIQWILMLVDSSESKDRVFALDLLSYLLNNTKQVDTSNLPESLQFYLTEAPIIFAILSRCDDASPVVRTKALTVVSQNMKNILNFLDKTKDQNDFEIEDDEDINEKDLEVNGNNRFFWYKLKSFRERLNEIANILHRRIEDNNVTARRAALLALENLIVFDVTYLSDENLKFFEYAAKDANILVRKQMIQSLSDVLDSYRDNIKIQESWVKCILPLIQDPESTVQSKALSVMEEQFVHKIFSLDKSDRECAFSLLRILISGEFLFQQRYLQKAFYNWKSENKLRSQLTLHFENHMETDWEECVWFYLSNFTRYCSLPSKMLYLCVERFEKYHSSGQFPSLMCYMLKVLLNVFQKLSSEQLKTIQNLISDNLTALNVPVSIIPLYIEVLFKIYKHIDKESEFFDFAFTLLEYCEGLLSEIQSRQPSDELPSVDSIAKCFCIIKELCLLRPSYITSNVISILKAFCGYGKPSKAFSRILITRVKAYAFAAVGKICLQDELLAKDLLPKLAKELLTSKDDIIRNNVVIVLIDMCKRYTSFADKYVPLISLCFKDRLYLIRYQTIILIVNLLQEGYIKWRGPLFFCLLSTLNDKRESIQELGRYSLCHLLSDKKKNLFSEHFVDSIFVFNNFPPPDNETIAQIVNDLDRFALKGEKRREERMMLYKFLLESMEVNDRAYLVKSINEIIMNIAETVYPLNALTETIVRDCFAILTCKEIRAFNVEQITEDIDEAAEKEFCKTELDTRRIVVIEPVIPVIVSLKNCIMSSESSLLQDLILFLKELLQDFKDSLKDLLAIDKTLLRQVEFEMKNEVEREKAEKRLEKEVASSGADKEQPATEVTIQGIQNMVNSSQYLISGKGTDKAFDTDVPLSQLVPCTPSGRPGTQRRHSQNKSPNKPGPSSANSPPITYNVVCSTPAEAQEIRRLASTPRVVLTPVQTSKTTVLDVSAIEKSGRFRTLDSSDEEMT